MTGNKTDEQIVAQIKQVLQEYIAPAVAGHGGHISFVSYSSGHLVLELGGACSGCAGSTMTLKMGVENMMAQMVPEVQSIEAFDDPNSSVDPFYSTPLVDFEKLNEGNSIDTNN